MNPFCLIPFLCLFLPPPPAPVIPDGQGGGVSFYNSRIMPDGTLRPYSPELDGILLADGSIAFPYLPPGSVEVGEPHFGPPMPAVPYRASPRPTEPGRAMPGAPLAAPSVPRKHGAIAPKSGEPWSGCYDDSGAPRNPVPPGCVTQSVPPLSRESYEPDHDRSM